MSSRTLYVKYVQITLTVALYWIVSIATVFVNKALLSNEEVDITYFVLWFQCFTSVVICCIFKFISRIYPQTLNFPGGSPFSRTAVYNVLPLSTLLCGMIIFNALCLKYAGVSFYYIGRSLTTIFNVLLTFLFYGKVSGKTILCCLVIVVGFFLGIDQESVLGTFSFVGTISGVLASLTLALYSVYTKKVLPFLDNSILCLSYYNNVYSCILLLPLLIFNGEFLKLLSFETTGKFWVLMVISGLFGFSIGYVTSLQIKVTSPLTHNISGTAKACFQTLIASYWYKEEKSILWWLSNYVILSGSFAYARVRQLEMERSAVQLLPN